MDLMEKDLQTQDGLTANPTHKIFSGAMQSIIHSSACSHESTTETHSTELLLDISNVESLQDALNNHFDSEIIEYTCEVCDRKGFARKRMFFNKLPVSLCITLKRFSEENGKIKKYMNTPQYLCLNDNSSKTVRYKLASIVAHMGETAQSGHYIAIGCAQDLQYYTFNQGLFLRN